MTKEKIWFGYFLAFVVTFGKLLWINLIERHWAIKGSEVNVE